MARDTVPVVRVQGALDIVSAPELGAALARAAADGEHRVVVDCAELSAVDADGLRVLVNMRRTLARRRRALVIRHVPDRVVARFVAAGLAGTIEDEPRAERTRRSGA
ncbi:MAG TPA: STAS domain-containing protein [Acidimicrobiia bacterium]|nr:STAS domain-containing protein [Acidimicrobiia bacterium]